MDRKVKVGIIGDYDPHRQYHIATNEALGHAATALSVSLTSSWIPTQSLAKGSVEEALKPYHALWCAPRRLLPWATASVVRRGAFWVRVVTSRRRAA